MNAPVFSTHGCRLNAYETEAMRELAAEAGLEGAVIVNTCAVTAEAVRKARKDIRKLRRENPALRPSRRPMRFWPRPRSQRTKSRRPTFRQEPGSCNSVPTIPKTWHAPNGINSPGVSTSTSPASPA